MLYRKVFCKDRLPKETDRLYDTNLGRLTFVNVSPITKWIDNYTMRLDPKYWLEEIPEPTDEELKGSLREGYENHLKHWRAEIGWTKPAYSRGFRDGFEFCCEYFKNKQ